MLKEWGQLVQKRVAVRMLGELVLRAVKSTCVKSIWMYGMFT